MAPQNHLLRDKAPIPVQAWKVIDEEAKQRLTPLLAARRVVDFEGPGGWAHDRYAIGRTTTLSGLPDGVSGVGAVARQRRVLPLAEVRVPFALERTEIDDIQRGATDPDLGGLEQAARDAALVETRAVFHGWSDAGIEGIAPSSSFPTMELGADCSLYPTKVAVAVDTMRREGIEGPYALALSPERYTQIAETTENGGYLLVEHLQRILHGSVVWAPGVDTAVLMTVRGGDFTLDVGQDFSIGYSQHDAEVVHLYLEESFTFWATEPDAALAFTS